MLAKVTNLDSISTRIDYGLTARASNLDTGYRLLRITDIREGAINWNEVPFCHCGAQDAKKYELQIGDIVFARTGSVGNSCLVTEVPPGAVFASYLIRIRPNVAFVHPLYLSYFFRTADYWQQVMGQASGAIQAGLNATKLRHLKVPLPPLPEQKRIAAILSKADRLRRLRRYARTLSDTYLQSVFLQMFYTDASRDWPRATIASLAQKKQNSIRTGPFGSQLLHSEFVDAGVAVLGIDNAVQNRFVWAKPRFISQEKYQQLKRYRVFPGDVVITIMGTTGRCAIIPDDVPVAINTKHLCCITLDHAKCLPTFLRSCFLNHPAVLQQLGVSERGAVMPGLNMGIIKSLELPLPPLSLQQRFDHIVDRFERLRSQQREAERQAEHLFQILLHQAFEGEL